MQQWEEYAEVEPFGLKMHNIMQAAICTALAEIFTGKQHSLTDFLLNFNKQPKTAEEIQAVLGAATRGHNRQP